jgi:hypothetical protein
MVGRPMYTSTLLDGSVFNVYMQQSLEPLFRFVVIRSAASPIMCVQVDVAVWCHTHSYERMCGITTNGTCADVDENGTVHGKLVW